MSRSRRPTAGLVAALLLGLLATPAAEAQDVALRVGTVLPAPDAEPLTDATLLVRAGKVEAIAHTLELPPGVPLIELPGAWVIPGLVDPWTGIAQRGDAGESAAAVVPDVLAGEHLDRRHPDWSRARAAGITTCLLSPGEATLVPGWGRVVRTSGVPWTGVEPVLRVVLGSAALDRDRPPTSRGSALALLRQALVAAHGDAGAQDPLRPFARGARAGLLTIESGADLRAALELQTAFGLQVLLQLDPGLTPDDLEGLALGPSVTALVGPYDLTSPPAALRLPAALAARGVRVAFTGHPPAGPDGGGRLSAVLAVRHGLAPRTALAGLTTVPAAALAVDGQAGSLAVGRPADLLVLDGPPLDLRSRVLGVWIDGRRVHPAPTGRGEAP